MFFTQNHNIQTGVQSKVYMGIKADLYHSGNYNVV